MEGGIGVFEVPKLLQVTDAKVGVAVQKERAAQEMYIQLASAYDASDLGRLFEALAEEESKHKLKLESFYDDAFMKED